MPLPFVFVAFCFRKTSPRFLRSRSRLSFVSSVLCVAALLWGLTGAGPLAVAARPLLVAMPASSVLLQQLHLDRISDTEDPHGAKCERYLARLVYGVWVIKLPSGVVDEDNAFHLPAPVR